MVVVRLCPRVAPQYLTILGLMVICGCSGDPVPVKLHKVQGKLTVKGESAPNIVVNFVPEKGRVCMGLTDATGTYKIAYDKTHDGITAGKYKVWIAFRPSNPTEDMAIREGRSPLNPEIQEALTKYGSEKTTPYTVTIDKDEKELLINLD